MSTGQLDQKMTLMLPLTQQRTQSQDKWMLRKEGVIWSSEQEIPEEMGRGVRG